MSAIGEYIHYQRSNYLKSGLHHLNKGTYEPYNFEKWIKLYITNIRNKESKYKLDTIEKSLNHIFSTNNNSSQIGDKTVEQIHKDVEKEMKEEFQEKCGTLDWATGNVVSKSENVTKEKLTQQQKAILSNLRQIKNEDNRYIQTVKQRINALMDIKITNKEKKDELNDKISNLQKKYFNILGLTEQECKKYSWGEKASGTFFKYFKEKGFNANEKKEELSGLTNDLNEVLKFVRDLLKERPVSEQIGTVFEYTNAAIKGLVLQQVDGSFDRIVEALKVGQKSERVEIKRSKIGRNIDIGTIGWSYTEGDEKIYISSSEQKVDIEYITEKGNKIKASDKSVNLGRGSLSLVKDAPLLSLLVSQEGDFVNHYLNLVSSHSKGRNSKDISGQLSAAREAVKLTIFWQSLAGGDERAQADIFVVNNNRSSSNGSVKVYDISKLAMAALTDFNNYVKITTNTSATIDNLKFKNNWSEESAWSRISYLLAEVRAVKIKTTFKNIQNIEIK